MRGTVIPLYAIMAWCSVNFTVGFTYTNTFHFLHQSLSGTV